MPTKKTPTPIGYLTVKEAAELCGIAWRTMYKHVNLGNIDQAGVRVINNCTFLRQREVEEFAEWRENLPKARAQKWGIPAREMIAEFEHIASIVGPELANRHLMRVYGLNENTIRNMQKTQARLQARREARNAA